MDDLHYATRAVHLDWKQKLAMQMYISVRAWLDESPDWSSMLLDKAAQGMSLHKAGDGALQGECLPCGSTA